MNTRLAVSALLLGLVSFAAAADPLPTTPPESVGLSSARLARITETLQADIGKGAIPGAVLLISRNGKIAYFEALGSIDADKKTPMSKDALFRIYSMTKPITTVAAMMLVEEGRLALADPVSRYIPQFKDAKVGEEKKDAEGKATLELVAPRRAMTVQDLMRHTSGLTYGFFGEGPVKKAYLEARIGDGDPTNAEYAERLARLPLAFQPGTTWDYSNSTDVLGRVIEVVTGKPLAQAFKDMLFDPLGMTETGFSIDPGKHGRIAEPLASDRKIGAGAEINDPRVPVKLEAGGHGLTSTAADYARFLQMLSNGGTLDGRRYLGPRTIAYMTSDHMGDVIRRGPYDLLGPGYKFGLGFAVRTDAGVTPIPGSAGDYHWGGAGGTAFWVDPKERMFVVFMLQSPSKRGQYRVLMRNMIYAAILD